MSNPAPIGVFDSGVGGLSVWREIAPLLPHEDILYLADQDHVPYGSRSLDEVRMFAEGIVRFLLEQDAKLIVVACNAVSAAALYYLRDRFPHMPFIGMEPALKPAAEQTRSGVVGVLATQATLQGGLFASLMERYADTVRVLAQACPGLVDAVEIGALDTPETEALLRRYLAPLVEAGADQVVLGCTHYPLLLPLIERIVGERVTVIDPAVAVARQTVRVLTQQGLEVEPGCAGAGRRVFYTSGDVAVFAALLRRLIPFIQEAEVYSVRWQGERLEV